MKRAVLYTAGLTLTLAAGGFLQALAQGPDGSGRAFDFADRGGVSLQSPEETGGDPVVSYTRIQPAGGSSLPPGFAIFGHRDDGVFITETTVPAVPLFHFGRTYAAYSAGGVDTAIAIANPGDQEVTFSFHFTDTNPNRVDPDFGHGSLTIGPGEQIATFLSAEPFNQPDNTRATFTFFSSVPVAVMTLAQFPNERGDLIYNTVPVLNLSEPRTPDTTVYIPHVATGGTWTTDFILINPTDQELRGQLIFVGRGLLNSENPNWDIPGQSTRVSVNNLFEPAYFYVVPPKGSFFFRTTLPLPSVQITSARVRPGSGEVAPVVHVVLQSLRIVEEGGLVGSDPISQAAYVGVASGTAFRMYVETSGDPVAPGSIRSGFAVHNIDFERTTLTAELTDLSGNLRATNQVPVPASGQGSYFVDEVFPEVDLRDSFQGVLRLSSVDQEFAVVGLRARRNERNEFQITTTPPFNEADTPASTEAFFPHLVTGGGWTTEAVFFSGATSQAGAGVMRFFGSDGVPVDVPLE